MVQSHNLVFAGIDSESREIGERRKSRPHRVREMDLLGIVIRFRSPIPAEVVAHSPTPSIVRITACSKGEGKKAEAAWLR
jgi:hypothetical protein